MAPYCAPAGCAPHLDGNGRPKRKGGGTYVLCGTHGKHGLCIVLRGLAVEDLVGSMVSVCALRPCSGRSCEKHGLCLCFAALQLALQWKILMEDLARELNVRPDAVRLGHVRSRLTE